MSKKRQRPNPKPAIRFPHWEKIGWGILVLLIVAGVTVSWRKWADPLVDFGRELYLPWQINQGAVIYRDMDANYGPLSQYWNAWVFQILGPGMIHLAMVNLAIYAGILGLLYFCLKTAWSASAAFVGSAVFILVFSFSQYVAVANYNFLAPYAHEATHGFFFLLLLIALLGFWLRNPRGLAALGAGLVCGVTLLLKIEVIFTAALVVFCAMVLAWRNRARVHVPWMICGAAFLIGGLVPPMAASAVLWMTGRFTPSEAFLWANSAWTGLFIYSGIASDHIQTAFLGLNRPMDNLLSILLTGGLSLLIACGLAWGIKTHPFSKKVHWGLAVALVIAAVYASLQLQWLEVGRALPVWLAAAAVFLWLRRKDSTSTSVQMGALLLVASIAFLGRMALNPRIYHYGFCQAALAGVVAVVAIWKLLPDCFHLTPPKRWAYLLIVGCFIGTGLWQMQSVSRNIYRAKTQSLGTGPDKMLGFSRQFNPTTRMLEDSRVFLSSQTDLRRLLVLPEGVMLNYLLRVPTSSHVYTFNPFWLKWRESILRDLEKTPPDYVVLIGRDLREYGVGRFGENPEHGMDLISWIHWNCARMASNGVDPLDPNLFGLEVYRYKGR